MKKQLLISLLFACSISIFAVDFGGTFGNTSTIADQTPDSGLKLDQKNFITAWLKIPFSFAEESSLLLQGKYQFERDFAVSENYNAVDADFVKFSFKTAGFAFDIGRFPVSDISNMIFTQSADGLKFSYNNNSLQTSFYGFYTGLLNSQFTTILDDDFVEDKTKVYDLCPAFMIFGANVNLPYLFKEQSLSLEGIFSSKLKEKSNIKAYGTFAMNGPLASSLFYNLSTSLSFSNYDNSGIEIGNLTQAQIIYYLNFYSSSVSFNSVYASGNNGSLKPFKGFTSQTAVNSLTSWEYCNLFKNGLSFSIKPVENIFAKCSFDVVINASKSFEYAGILPALSVNYQIVSDVFIGADASFFVANDSANSKNEIVVRAAISF